jgi:Serine/threonine protein kinase
LEYIHHCGYVHADLKPANVLLGVDSSQAIVNIVDFGLASRYKDTDDNHKAHIVEKKSAHNGESCLSLRKLFMQKVPGSMLTIEKKQIHEEKPFIFWLQIF